MLSRVAGLNQKGRGMQVSGSGELPVSGLVPKMAANIPKGRWKLTKRPGWRSGLRGREGKQGRVAAMDDGERAAG